MPRFFIQPHQITDNVVHITGDDAHHIARSLRMAVGEHVTVCDGQREYDCELLEFERDELVSARVIASEALKGEPPYSVTLYQALPKGDKLDMIIQKAVECGAMAVVPFESDHCVVRMRPDAEERKTERRARIALEAAKQCGRGFLPTVSPTVSFADMLNQAKQADVVLFCYEGDQTIPMRTLLNGMRAEGKLGTNPTISVIIGSEGGFSEKEARSASEQGFCMVGLGSRILRTETASCFVLSNLVYEFEL